MLHTASLHRASRWPFRLGAFVCVGLLLLLNWLAFDFAAHAHLHAEAGCAQADGGHAHDAPAAPHDDADCVITQFAQGATDLLLWAIFSFAIFLHAPAGRWSRGEFRWSRAPFAWPAPSCGPPVRA